MKKDSIIDYLGYIALRLLGPPIRKLPLTVVLFLGRRIGELLYYFDLKHKSIAYANIKMAFKDRLAPRKLKQLTKNFYRTFGQNFIEIFLIPLVNREYIDRYIKIEGKVHIQEGFAKNRGIIFLGMHAGSWELSNIICAYLGFSFSLFIREQRHPRLDNLLNSYRSQKGCKVIQRQGQLRQLIRALKNNESIGMTVDQGGKTGTLVEFFGKKAALASGAVRLALRYGVTVLPVFFTRVSGPYIKLIIEPPFEIKQTGEEEKDVQENLQRLIHTFEKYILQYPQEYLWTYKIWKYSDEKDILILDDGKVGHLRQAQALADTLKDYYREKGIRTQVTTIEVKFSRPGPKIAGGIPPEAGKHKIAKAACLFSSCLSGKYQCQGCLWCLRAFLEEDNYQSLITKKPDIIISCGAAIAPVNYVLSRENLANSFVVMRPSILSIKRFNLVIIPKHDRPAKRKNVLITEGALNLIDQEYLNSCASSIPPYLSEEIDGHLIIGLLIGGDTRAFRLDKQVIIEAIRQIKSAAEELNAHLLITTSRRTPQEIDTLVKREFEKYPRTKFLVIAKEKNFPFAVGGILALSKIAIVSPESISMISEAASSSRYVVVFKAQLPRRHKRFLDYMAEKRYIYLCEPGQISSLIDMLWKKQPALQVLKDRERVKEALQKIL